MKHNFKNCLVVANSNSTHIKRAMQLVGRLNHYFPAERVDFMEISNLNYEETRRLIRRKSARLSSSSLVCVAGGDGTLNRVINILLAEPGISPSARQSVILPLWGGNGNDLAIMANGFIQKTSLERVLANGKAIAIHPLAVTLRHNRRAGLHLAACYASFGVTAAVSKLINHPDYRHKRVYNLALVRAVIEIGLAFKAFVAAKPFMVELGDERTALYDFVLINGSRMAKRQRFPVRLTDANFIEASVRRKLPGLFLYLLHAVNWRSGRPGKTERSLTIHDSIWMQLDGEVIKVPGQTTIGVKSHKRPFYLLSTKLG